MIARENSSEGDQGREGHVSTDAYRKELRKTELKLKVMVPLINLENTK
uniref:Uncharacterized protein n=1 Tax=Kalanchoe fedtschenkoi TaxID=63787 RepID=A0A7N0VDY4_KALFE